MKTEVLVYVLSYVVFVALCWKSKKGGYLKLFDEFGNFTSRPMQLIVFHLSGVILLGVIPLLLLKNDLTKGVEYPRLSNPIDILIYAAFFLLLMFIAFWQSRVVFGKMHNVNPNGVNLAVIPIVAYLSVRLLFLAVYECWFRGLLLFSCVDWFGTTSAVIVNLILYVSAHAFSGKKEMLACLPFGLLVCFFSLTFNSCWPAVLLHVCFSFVYECSMLYNYRNNFKIQLS